MMQKEKLIELLDMNCGYTAEMKADDLADYLMDNGVTVQEWISVKDRLPDVGQKILACGVHHGMEVQQFHSAHFTKDGKCFWEWKKNTVKCITHWMPLPEPPKEDTLWTTV